MIDINEYGKQFLEDYHNKDFEVILTKYRKKKICELIKNYNTAHMLEIGCGMEPFFIDYGNFESMTVVEPAEIMYKSALEWNKQFKYNVDIINDFVENQVNKLQETNWDLILCVGLIHEVEDAEGLIAAIRKICAKNTVVLISTSNPNSFHLTLAYESGIIPQLGVLTDKAKSFQRRRTFTMSEMKQLLGKHNFSIIEEGSYFVKPFAHHQMKALLDNKIITENVIEGLDKMIKYMPDLGAEIYCVVSPK